LIKTKSRNEVHNRRGNLGTSIAREISKFQKNNQVTTEENTASIAYLEKAGITLFPHNTIILVGRNMLL
jgi:hypothetical protein